MQNTDLVISELRKRAPVRATRAVAQKLLMDNTTINLQGNVRYLRMKNLGLGVWEITLADIDSKKENLIIK